MARPASASTHPARIHAALPLATALLQVLTIHTCYVISASADLIPMCVPYLDGCTSVSSAGRYGISYGLFKAGMLPAALLTGYCWWLCRPWLRALGHDDDGRLRTLAWTGIIAAAFLALYVVFLGSRGDFYNFMRRFGVTVFFGASYLGQLQLLARLHALPGRPLRPATLHAFQALAIVLMALGIGSIPVSNFFPAAKQITNAIEWNFCLLLAVHQVLLWRAWRQTGGPHHTP